MKKIIGLVLICVLLIGAFFQHLGAAESTAPVAEATAPEESNEWNLRLSMTSDVGAGFTTIPLEQGNYKEVSYLDVSNVTIDIDGTPMKLEEALLGGHITPDEMIACARKDASMGFCREVAKSKNGLTEFTYRYGEFTILHVYDLYECPDGRRQLLTDFLIYDARSEPHFHPTDPETGERIDYEDWGLSFEISEVDASGITVSFSQSGGQQMGKLNVGLHNLYRKDPNTLAFEQVEPLTEEGEPILFMGLGDKSWEPDPNRFLTMGGTKELSYNFTRLYGELPAGDYRIDLQIVDCYNEEVVHPLMRNYRDDQWYSIEFTIK